MCNHSQVVRVGRDLIVRTEAPYGPSRAGPSTECACNVLTMSPEHRVPGLWSVPAPRGPPLDGLTPSLSLPFEMILQVFMTAACLSEQGTARGPCAHRLGKCTEPHSGSVEFAHLAQSRLGAAEPAFSPLLAPPCLVSTN